MPRKKKNKQCCATPEKNAECCKVESLASVDERGQMVIPKEIREKANIKPGDKLAITVWEKDGKVCCISLIKADDFADKIRELLGHMLEEISKK
jgi:AbrB family looped-hinge helix DNA binding protein